MESVAAAETRTKDYVANFISLRRLSKSSLNSTDINVSILPYFTNKHVGKVRDTYICDDLVILICTDRQSAFDRNIASIPFKGQVLNLTSAWWFEQTKTLVPNHVISIPHPNVTIGKKCSVFPIEFVMRGYITGSTSTSIWTNYSKGIRSYCGHKLPDGLSKNMKLETNLLTPTTKDDYHDELISAEDVVLTGKMTQSDWDTCAKYSQLLFSFGQATALQNGLILVDTKYEFGKDPNGNIILVDEIHTPDSSRYWICSTYNERVSNNLEPENVDKEFLRKWYIEHCDPYNDIDLPCAPDYLVDELSRRYIMLFELITGKNFDFKESPSLSIEESLKKFFEK